MEYPKYAGLRDIIGLQVHSIRGMPKRKNAKTIEPEVILFTDGKTYIELEEQDLCYHDCSPCAKELQTRVSEEAWQRYIDDYLDSNTDI